MTSSKTGADRAGLTCKTCKFSGPSSWQSRAIECLRFPPAWTGQEFAHPQLYEDDRCGEYAAAPSTTDAGNGDGGEG